MRRSGVPVRRGRPLVAAGAAAAIVVGLVLVVSILVGGGSAPPPGWPLMLCLPGAGLEGALLRSTARHRAVLVATVLGALVAGAAVWPSGAALLAAVVALTCVPVAIASAFALPARSVRMPAIVFRVLVAIGLVGVLPATNTAAAAFWTVATAAAVTALTIHTAGRPRSRRLAQDLPA